MFISKEEFEAWMKRIMERFDMLERKITGKEKVRPRINGELLYDNQDLCFMMNISKRTLQRYRSLELLPFKRIDQKTYYLESDVQKFIREHLQKPGNGKGEVS
ncbi:Helix-turn-helix domain protein [Bacteroidales bacterium Barb7]|nr:Helix-turn-helix domain protein [Bacteroidales bacterium Barb7]